MVYCVNRVSGINSKLTFITCCDIKFNPLHGEIITLFSSEAISQLLLVDAVANERKRNVIGTINLFSGLIKDLR